MKYPFYRYVLPPALVVLAAGLVFLLTRLRPEPDTSEPERAIPAVEVFPVAAAPVQLQVETQGTVSPFRETTLTAEVSGRIIEVSPAFQTGAFVDAGDRLLKIDPTDYEAALASARSELARAELALSQEKAAREQARADWERLGRGEPAPLVLREPQIAQARAAIEAARAAVRQARDDLAQTRVRAPYSGRVRSRQVDLGQFVTAGATVFGTLYGTDRAEVRLPVNAREVGYLALGALLQGRVGDTTGPAVTLSADYGGNTHRWTGRVVRTDGTIDPQNRLTYLIAQVDDPYGLQSVGERPPLKIGLFVEAAIAGRQLERAFRIPRSAVQPDGTVLVVRTDDTLVQRRVRVVKADRRTVVVDDGLEDGDRLCLTALPFFIDGMTVDPSPAPPEAVPPELRDQLGADILAETPERGKDEA
ncbi:MAG: efflux RND transporter periplasmic adaptor subunit [Opitutales bacterium]